MILMNLELVSSWNSFCHNSVWFIESNPRLKSIKMAYKVLFLYLKLRLYNGIQREYTVFSASIFPKAKSLFWNDIIFLCPQIQPPVQDFFLHFGYIIQKSNRSVIFWVICVKLFLQKMCMYLRPPS